MSPEFRTCELYIQLMRRLFVMFAGQDYLDTLVGDEYRRAILYKVPWILMSCSCRMHFLTVCLTGAILHTRPKCSLRIAFVVFLKSNV